MTAPTGREVSLEEASSALATPKGTDAALKLEGEHIPEPLRGKTLDDVIKMNAAAMESLRISEDARKAAEARGTASTVTREVVREVAPTTPERALTDEELSEAFEKNPLLAVKYMAEQAKKDIERNLDARLGPLGASAMANGENYAKEKYKTEYAVLGPEIEVLKAEILKNGGQASLSTPNGWDQVISYVRGKPGNFEKIIDHRTKADGAAAAAAARDAQARGAGFSPAPTAGGEAPQTRVTAISDAAGLDEIQCQIADKFIDQGVFKNRAEYAKWSKIGG